MKKVLKRVCAALFSAALLMTVLAACGGNGDSSTPASSGGNSSAGTSSAAPESKQPESSGTGASDGEITKLKVLGFQYTPTTDDCAAVSEAVSAITREKIGVEVEITMFGDSEKLNLALNSGEVWDLVNYHGFSGGLPTLVNTGMVQPIGDLVDQYGKEMVEKLGEEYLVLGEVGGELYSVPSRTQVAANAYGLFMRKDILDEINVNVDDIKSYDDMHEVLLKVKEHRPDIYPVISTWGGGGMQKTFAWDNLGTGFWDGTGILENCHDSSTTVVNMFETESYKNFVTEMYKWKQDGLLMPDGATSNESQLIENDKGFALFDNYGDSKEDAAMRHTNAWGCEAVVWQIVDPFITSDAGGSSFVIPTSCEHPDKAVQLWNLMYTDPEIDNILCNGVEGIHYEYTDDSKQFVKKLDSSTWDYNYYWGWPNGKEFVIQDGTDPEARVREDEIFKSAAASPALGFKYDNSGVMNEITACGNVIAKYETALRWGELDPAEALPKLNEELYAAGLQTIIDDKQAQLDAFLGK